MRFRIIVEQDEDGMYVAQCATLPGCISQGKKRSEALKNMKDAMEGYIASLKKHNEPFRRLTVPNHAEIAKGTLLAIVKQAGLTREEFFELL